jgi:hypothetical protein
MLAEVYIGNEILFEATFYDVNTGDVATASSAHLFVQHSDDSTATEVLPATQTVGHWTWRYAPDRSGIWNVRVETTLSARDDVFNVIASELNVP